MDYYTGINAMGTKGMQFCDYIEVTDVNDDVYLYNVYHSNRYGFCLISDDEPLIKFLHINNSRLDFYYATGEVKNSDIEAKKIKIDSHWIEKKLMGFSIEGTLLQYNDEMGMKYGLNSEEHYNKYPKCYGNNVKIKKKIKGE